MKNTSSQSRGFSVFFGLMSIMALLISPLTVSDLYAEKSHTLEWQLLFIQEAECNPSDNLNEIYSNLTTKYFEMYQLENQNHQALCMTESDYSNYQISEDIDLLILVYNGNIAEKILKPNKIDGVYIHTGNDRSKNHLVIMCHCSNFDSSYDQILPSWILTHELSHFVLSYKGYPPSIVQNAIHEIENEYDTCIGTNFQNEYCMDFKTIIRSDLTSKDFPVMKPYEDAIGQKLVNYISDDFSDSNIINLQRNIAKMWITNEIDDSAYLHTLENFIDTPTDFQNNDSLQLMQIKNGFVIAENSKPKDVTWDEYLNPDTNIEDNTNLIINQIPFSLDEEHVESNTKEMPNWFKTRALLWSEKRISDKVFFDGVEHLVRMGIVNFE